jgi:hypothetical protein
MDPVRHADLTERFVAWADGTESIAALIGVGSTSGTRPADRWSDHDLLIVTADPAEADRLREDPTGLPLPGDPLLAFTEPDHGLTVILDDGHLIELAICGPEELGWFAADRHRVLVDRIGVSSTLDRALQRNRAGSGSATVEVAARYHHLVKEIVVVISRLGRGERISAHRHLQAAVDDLLALVQLSGHIGTPRWSDPFDPARRLERTDPELAARLDAVLSVPLEDAVVRTLELLADHVVPTLGGDAGTVQAALERRLDEALGVGVQGR